jgi:hypothetical protein
MPRSTEISRWSSCTRAVEAGFESLGYARFKNGCRAMHYGFGCDGSGDDEDG